MFAIAVMPCWNYAGITKNAVDTIRAHAENHRVHFVFVDNGSTDSTYNYLRSVPDSSVIHNRKNELVTHAWNQGLEKAMEVDTEAIFLLNNDVRAGPKWMDSVSRAIELDGEDRYYHPYAPFQNTADVFEVMERAIPHFKDRRTIAKCGWAYFFRADAVPKFMPIPEELRLWHGDNWIHYNLIIKNGYFREGLMDCLWIHRGSISFNALGQHTNITGIVAPDTQAFERMLGMTVTEYVGMEDAAQHKYMESHNIVLRRNNGEVWHEYAQGSDPTGR
jgi:glycosyltransferase involved in cell wall biosynthesis